MAKREIEPGTGAANQDGRGFFTELTLGYRRAKAVMAAHELGVFSALATESLSVPALADRTRCSERGLTVLCDALIELGLLERCDGKLANTPLAAGTLVPGAPAYVGHNLKAQNILLECWSHLEQVVREGRPHRHLSELNAGQEAAFAREYIRGMLPISTQPAQAIAEVFGKRPLRRILDVGCGPGVYALALLDNHPEATATLFDLPDALPVTRELVADHPHAARLRYEPGDYRRNEYGKDYDLILMSHTTHDESPETVQGMFAKAFAALRPGGMLAVHDWVAARDAVDREFSAFFSLHMLVYTDGGRTYGLDEYRTMLEAVGFTGFRTESIQAGSVRNPTTLVMADRAARA